MRKVILLCVLLTAFCTANAQQKTAEENIKELLRLTGSGEIGVQMITQMVTSYKEQMPDVPAEFWDGFMKEVNPDDLVNLVVPVYAKYYTEKDVLELIAFYKSPLGQKLTRSLPFIMADSYKAGEEWGRKLGENVLKKLKEKGHMQ